MAIDASQPGIVAMIIIMIVVATVSTGLRFWSRAVVLAGQYRMDDWLALAALFPVLGLLATGLALAYAGAGKHEKALTLAQVENCAKIFFIGSIFFDFSMGLAKFSALAFYRRVFGMGRYRSRSWTISLAVACAFTFAWFITSVMYGVFRCSPVRSAWEVTIPHTCAGEFDTYMIIMAVLNVITDVVIVLIPIPQIVNLKMKPRKKFVVVSLLLVGYCIPLISIGRLVTAVQIRGTLTNDFTYGIIDLGFWLLAEPAVSLLAISLPAFSQLTMRARKYGIRALFTTRDLDKRPGRRFASYNRYHFNNSVGSELRPMGNGKSFASCAGGMVESDVTSRSKSVPKVVEDSDSDTVLPLQVPEMIHVRTELTVTYDDWRLDDPVFQHDSDVDHSGSDASTK